MFKQDYHEVSNLQPWYFEGDKDITEENVRMVMCKGLIVAPIPLIEGTPYNFFGIIEGPSIKKRTLFGRATVYVEPLLVVLRYFCMAVVRSSCEAS